MNMNKIRSAQNNWFLSHPQSTLATEAFDHLLTKSKKQRTDAKDTDLHSKVTKTAKGKEEAETNSNIIVKPDGSRVLVLTCKVGGMETTRSIQISDPTELQNSEQQPDILETEKESQESADNNSEVTETTECVQVLSQTEGTL